MVCYSKPNNFQHTNIPAEAQKKKHLTAEEHAMRRAEMARRRKNLSEKRNEEEKVSTNASIAAYNSHWLSREWKTDFS